VQRATKSRKELLAELVRSKQLPPARVTPAELAERAAAAAASGLTFSDWIRVKTEPRPRRKT